MNGYHKILLVLKFEFDHIDFDNEFNTSSSYDMLIH